jgi:hypothetical protein
MNVTPSSAAIYLRMSTETNIFARQSASGHSMTAEQHGFAIVKKYFDNAKSGLL